MGTKQQANKTDKCQKNKKNNNNQEMAKLQFRKNRICHFFGQIQKCRVQTKTNCSWGQSNSHIRQTDKWQNDKKNNNQEMAELQFRKKSYLPIS